MNTTLEEIKNILAEIRENKNMMDGAIAMEKAILLSTYQANLVEEIAIAQQEYSQALDLLLEENEKMSVSRAKIKLESFDLYRELNKKTKMSAVVLEEIRSLRAFAKIRQGEYEGSHNF